MLDLFDSQASGFSASAGSWPTPAAVHENESMCIHMFAFRWQSGVTTEQKQKVIQSIRELQGQIPGLLETWVGENFSPRSQGYSLGGVMKFSDRAALDAYGAHPVHQALLAWLMPLIEPVEVDFMA